MSFVKLKLIYMMMNYDLHYIFHLIRDIVTKLMMLQF